MPVKRKGLGKGLDSLIPENKSAKVSSSESKKTEEKAASR